jgi:hypothetical protein
MKGLGQRCVQCVNRTYRRTGTLFEGRFRSSVIEADSYLLACQRQIAAMVGRPKKGAPEMISCRNVRQSLLIRPFRYLTDYGALCRIVLQDGSGMR